MDRNKNILFLFDVDGTLTVPRNEADDEMLTFLKELRRDHHVGFVGGSDLPKQQHQLHGQALELFDFCFPENGLVFFEQGEKKDEMTITKHFEQRGQLKRLEEFISRCLVLCAQEDLPYKRGCFVEYRTGLINVSPAGRNCTQEERMEFYAFDQEAKVRAKFIKILQEEFADLELKFSIGGQISFDVFPQGWDKTYCLKHLLPCGFEKICFFGDKTFEGGNDYEIFHDDRVVGHTVTSPADTRRIVADILAGLNEN
ncbi:MAG: hypothetical protein MHM6MM_001702 [Cercozoa sp. M6MM]